MLLLCALFLVGCCYESDAGIDWLVERINVRTSFTKTKTGSYLLTNGLIAREFVIKPNFATIDFRELQLTQASVLRAINPESIVTLNGRQYNVGGFISNMPKAYLNRTALWENYTKDESAFQMVNIHVGKPEARFPYIPARGAPKNIVWPPPGLRLTIDFEPPKTAPENIQLMKIRLFYEMYDEIPLLSKWIEIQNIGLNVLEQPVVEYLAVNWQWRQKTYVEPRLDGAYLTRGWLHVEADEQQSPSVQWSYTDPATKNEWGAFAAVVNCTYVPFKLWKQQDNFISYRVNELVIGSDDMERVALSRHRMIRLLAPHTQENPIFFHMINTSSDAFKTLVDQLAKVGFEMIIYSFGTGFNVESDNETYIAEIKQMVDYAKSKGIEVGAYDLIALSRGGNASWEALNPSNKSTGSMCFASEWYDYLTTRVWNFYRKTGLTAIETDGPYGGYSCNSKSHKHHRDVDDSVIRQAQLHKEFNLKVRRSRWYMNQPSFDFYTGASKTGMGYDENQYSLPRWQDISISRQSIFEGTWVLHTTQGWMAVNLVENNHGGGPGTYWEPMAKHLQSFDFALSQNLGAGVGAIYRGFRIYDTDKTKIVVKKWVDFYNKHRSILTSDIVHLRYPDMQGIDAMLHVNPWLEEKGLLMVYNPTRDAIKTNLRVRLYHTGLKDCIQIQKMDGSPYKSKVDRGYKVFLDIDIPAISAQWYLFYNCNHYVPVFGP